MSALRLFYNRRLSTLIWADLVVLLVSVYIAHLLRFGAGWSLRSIFTDYYGAAGIFVVTNIVALYVVGAYDQTFSFTRPNHLLRFGMVSVVAAGVQMVSFYLLPTWWWGRGIALLAGGVYAILLPATRLVLAQTRSETDPRINTLVVGAHESGLLIEQALTNQRADNRLFSFVGFVERGEGYEACRAPVLGHPTELEALVTEHDVGMVVVAETGPMDAQLLAQLLACKRRGVVVQDMPTTYKQLTGKVPIYHLSDTWLVFGPQFTGSFGLGSSLQRVADVLVALVGLTLSAPLILLAAVAIRLESSGGVFFHQQRVGLNEQPFTIHKLRTMVADAEASTGPMWSTGRRDARVTRVGRFLRRTRIDELPQFYNVLKGDMSFVGPRPEREFFVEQLKEEIPFYSLRFAVKPGLTGWAQVNHGYGANADDAAEKLRYELFAVQEIDPVLYVLIGLKTIQTVLMHPGS